MSMEMPPFICHISLLMTILTLIYIKKYLLTEMCTGQLGAWGVKSTFLTIGDKKNFMHRGLKKVLCFSPFLALSLNIWANFQGCPLSVSDFIFLRMGGKIKVDDGGTPQASPTLCPSLVLVHTTYHVHCALKRVTIDWFFFRIPDEVTNFNSKRSNRLHCWDRYKRYLVTKAASSWRESSASRPRIRLKSSEHSKTISSS